MPATSVRKFDFNIAIQIYSPKFRVYTIATGLYQFFSDNLFNTFMALSASL